MTRLPPAWLPLLLASVMLLEGCATVQGGQVVCVRDPLTGIMKCRIEGEGEVKDGVRTV